jgi:hypothetical protein
MSLEKTFDIHSLGSKALMKLYHQANSLIKEIRIETVPRRRSDYLSEDYPVATIGLPRGIPTIQFADSLSRMERIEAIAHELVHLLLVYRYGLGLTIGLKIPWCGHNGDAFLYFMSVGEKWEYLLGQLSNTAHHLVLIDYLKDKYGVESHLHLHLLHQHSSALAKESPNDKESLCARGVVAFEYEKLIGNVDRLIDLDHQTDWFRKSYQSAQNHFGKYSVQRIPTPFFYKEDILSFLEDLGYKREDFIFLPEGEGFR